jgi:hypothetical protein
MSLDDYIGAEIGPEYERDGHLWQWRRGRVVHLAACPCWRDDVDTAAVIRGRWQTIAPGDPLDDRPTWRRWLGL